MLLADEPIASLDPRNAKRVMDALKTIHEDGVTVICNLHTLDTARAYCTRIVGMAQGRVVFDGPAAELTAAAAREIYAGGDEEDQAVFEEGLTSLSVTADPEPAAKAS